MIPEVQRIGVTKKHAGKHHVLYVDVVCTEQEELLREMGQQAARPTPEVGLLRQQIDQLHSRHRTEMALLEHEKLQLQQRLQAEVFDCIRRFVMWIPYVVFIIHTCNCSGA